MEVGSVVKVKIVKITKFGALAELEDGSEGIIHISQVSHDYVRNVEDYLRVGDEVEAKILNFKENGKLDLSLKALEEDANKRVTIRKGQDPTFEKMLKEYLRTSEENHGILKRRREGR